MHNNGGPSIIFIPHQKLFFSTFRSSRRFYKNIGKIFRNMIGAIALKIYEGCSWEAVNRAFIASILENCNALITKDEIIEWIKD